MHPMPAPQTGPKDCLPQCGNKRLCRLGRTPSISIPGSHLLEAPFCLYAAWLLIERRHAGYSRLFPHWCKGCFGHVCAPHPDDRLLRVRALIAEAVHDAVCAFSRSDGFRLCQLSTVAGYSLLANIDGPQWIMQV
jgi:hypothetical protein